MRQLSVFLLVALVALVPGTALGQDASEGSSALEILGARPFLEVGYGLATPGYEGSDFDFESIGLLDFKLGYTVTDSVQPGISSLFQSYLLGSLGNADLGSSGSEGDVGSELGRFGGGNRMGFGYQGSAVGLDLYNENALSWTKFTAADDPVNDPEAEAVFDRFGSQYRFGQVVAAGANLRFNDSFGLGAGAEGSIIYPRYVFWPWLGSALIYGGVQSVVEYFADEVMRGSPTLGPALYFLLKTGVSLGYFLASQDDMNWPFDSEKPVTVATFKLSASFTF